MYIIGDSFIRRLDVYLKSNDRQLNVRGYDVQILGWGGATVCSLREHVKPIDFKGRARDG